MGIGIVFDDKVERSISLEKLLKPVAASSDESAGDLNEIQV